MILEWGTAGTATKQTGTVTVEVYPDRILNDAGASIHSGAWLTAENFLIAVRAGLYDNTNFFRLVPQFMMQGGDIMDNDGSDNRAVAYNDVCNGMKGIAKAGCSPKYWTLPGEQLGSGDNGFVNEPYALVSTLSGNRPDTAGSQFFIIAGDAVAQDGSGIRGAPDLDGKHTVFGAVIIGHAVIDAVMSVPTNNDKPNFGVTIKEAWITGHREDPPVPPPELRPPSAAPTSPAAGGGRVPLHYESSHLDDDEETHIMLWMSFGLTLFCAMYLYLSQIAVARHLGMPLKMLFRQGMQEQESYMHHELMHLKAEINRLSKVCTIYLLLCSYRTCRIS